jgi:hypothetical protein
MVSYGTWIKQKLVSRPRAIHPAWCAPVHLGGPAFDPWCLLKCKWRSFIFRNYNPFLMEGCSAHPYGGYYDFFLMKYIQVNELLYHSLVMAIRMSEILRSWHRKWVPNFLLLRKRGVVAELYTREMPRCIGVVCPCPRTPPRLFPGHGLPPSTQNRSECQKLLGMSIIF